MQVKKFEAPTLQEALDAIKRELGPEAIIMQTKRNKRGFGLMSRSSVEVTVAVSERSLQKKQYADVRLGEGNRTALSKAPAEKQAEVYDRMTDRAQEKSARKGKPRPITSTRYVEIDADSRPTPRAAAPAPRPAAQAMEAAASIQSQGQSHGQGSAAMATVAERVPAASAAPAFAGATINDEVRHLKRMVEELKIAQEEGVTGAGAQALIGQGTLGTPALQDAFEQLVLNGVDKRFAIPLLKRAAFELGVERARSPDAVLDQLASEIMETVEIASPLSGIRPQAGSEKQSGPAVIALVGPTGVGKTTTVAKIASDALLRRNLKVGLINLDGYKVAAFDQLGTYAKILNVPFRAAQDADELAAAIRDFQSLDLVLIDTTGRSQRDPDALKAMRDVLAGVPDVRAELVLAVTTRDAELYDMASRFAVFRPQGIIVSKLDEATSYGSILNVSQKAKLPLHYFTTGQRVPEDLEEATRERVAALILDL
jgi:flagellar biosynthesis protein FlhF